MSRVLFTAGAAEVLNKQGAAGLGETSGQCGGIVMMIAVGGARCKQVWSHSTPRCNGSCCPTLVFAICSSQSPSTLLLCSLLCALCCAQNTSNHMLLIVCNRVR